MIVSMYAVTLGFTIKYIATILTHSNPYKRSHTHTYTRTHKHTHIHTNTHTHTHTYIYIYMRVYVEGLYTLQA